MQVLYASLFPYGRVIVGRIVVAALRVKRIRWYNDPTHAWSRHGKAYIGSIFGNVRSDKPSQNAFYNMDIDLRSGDPQVDCRGTQLVIELRGKVG